MVPKIVHRLAARVMLYNINILLYVHRIIESVVIQIYNKNIKSVDFTTPLGVWQAKEGRAQDCSVGESVRSLIGNGSSNRG